MAEKKRDNEEKQSFLERVRGMQQRELRKGTCEGEEKLREMNVKREAVKR